MRPMELRIPLRGEAEPPDHRELSRAAHFALRGIRRVVVVVLLLSFTSVASAQYEPVQDEVAPRGSLRRTVPIIASPLLESPAPEVPADTDPVDTGAAEDWSADEILLPLPPESAMLPSLPPASGIGEPLREPLLPTDWVEAAPLQGLGYRGAGHDQGAAWLIGNGNHLGIFTLATGEDELDEQMALLHLPTIDWAVHFVMGPKATDLPPRLYDLLLRWGHKAQLNDRLALDVSFTLGFYTDFEGSARKGFRWPSTAVLEYQAHDNAKWLVGVDILDRDDYFCLPVAGLVWTPTPDLRLDIVFPKPRVAFQTRRLGWLYFAGQMGGGMWGIDRAWGAQDVVTYRDLRVSVGLQKNAGPIPVLFTEIGWAFARHLEYRSGIGDYDPFGTLFLSSTIIY